jgi:transcriptional regulator with XRE-family HTH domain
VFGKRLKTLREKYALSQADLARLSGIPVKTIQNWEQTDAPEPRIEALRKLAKAFERSLMELLPDLIETDKEEGGSDAQAG